MINHNEIAPITNDAKHPDVILMFDLDPQHPSFNASQIL